MNLIDLLCTIYVDGRLVSLECLRGYDRCGPMKSSVYVRASADESIRESWQIKLVSVMCAEMTSLSSMMTYPFIAIELIPLSNTYHRFGVLLLITNTNGQMA